MRWRRLRLLSLCECVHPFAQLDLEPLFPIISAWATKRFVDLCFAFRPLDLPLLQLLLIIEMDAIQLGYTRFLPILLIQWNRGKLIRLTPMEPI